jgi:hypothetical protein
MSKLIILLGCAYTSLDGPSYEDGDHAELNYTEALPLVTSGAAKVVRFTDEAEVSAKPEKRITKEDKIATFKDSKVVK